MNARALALALSLAVPCLPPEAAVAAGRTSLDDDYPAALALAKARNVPIVVDVWAPW